MEAKTPKGKLVTNIKWCKGCKICVEFCSRGVLSLTPQGKVHIDHPEKCISCKLCELFCPDFAISVEVTQDAKK